MLSGDTEGGRMNIRILVAACAALAFAGCLEETTDTTDGGEILSDESSGPAEGEAAPPAIPVKLYALDCGHLAVADAGIFSDEHVYDGQARELADPCYLIRHPSGDLLWDTGVASAIHDMPGGMKRGPYTLTAPTTLASQLEVLGLAPADIDYVSVSHSHPDHAGNLNLFAGATWVVDKDERDWMFRDEARADPAFANYSQMETAKTVLIEGDGPYDVFGDGSVVIHQTPGHTPGHTSLLVRLPGYGPALLAGDLYPLKEAREKRTVPTGNTDRAQTLASMDKVEELARANGAKVIRQHVPDDFASMPKFPMPAE
jgi:N-acyl homoserine lactone hydrolase